MGWFPCPACCGKCLYYEDDFDGDPAGTWPTFGAAGFGSDHWDTNCGHWSRHNAGPGLNSYIHAAQDSAAAHYAICDVTHPNSETAVVVATTVKRMVESHYRVITNYVDANNYDFVEVHIEDQTSSTLFFYRRAAGANNQVGVSPGLAFGGSAGGQMLVIKVCRWGNAMAVELHPYDVGAGAPDPYYGGGADEIICHERIGPQGNGESFVSPVSDLAGVGVGPYIEGEGNTYVPFYDFKLYKHITTHLECEECCEGPPEECPCLKVVLDGIVDSGDCPCCEYLNGTYYLREMPGDEPLWTGELFFASRYCGHRLITAGIEEVEGASWNTYRLVVRLGDHKWEKDLTDEQYGTLPDCPAWEDLVLANVTSDTECDSTASTAAVSNAPDEAWCLNQRDCRVCICDRVPERFQVVISGVAGAKCPDCSALNGTHIVEMGRIKLGAWPYCSGYSVVHLCGYDLLLQLAFLVVPPYSIRVGIDVLYGHFWRRTEATYLDCMNFSNLVLPVFGGSNPVVHVCNLESSTCLVTSL